MSVTIIKTCDHCGTRWEQQTGLVRVSNQVIRVCDRTPFNGELCISCKDELIEEITHLIKHHKRTNAPPATPSRQHHQDTQDHETDVT